MRVFNFTLKNNRLRGYFFGIKIFSIRIYNSNNNGIIENKMKLGASYNLFDGEELLEPSILSIRKNVDYINVVYQNISNFGEQATSSLEESLIKLKQKGLIDKIIKYTADLKQDGHYNEITKRNIGLDDCKKEHCSHFMTIDVDEFYISEQFISAKDFIYKNNISHSYCPMYYYISSPKYRTACVRQTSYVPFIYKINKLSQLVAGGGVCVCDPTRQMGNSMIEQKSYVFSARELTMHHMAYVRTNLAKKFRNSTLNSSAPEQLKNYNERCERILSYTFPERILMTYEEEEIIEVDDIFNVEPYLKR